jgi:hypothetical protein
MRVKGRWWLAGFAVAVALVSGPATGRADDRPLMTVVLLPSLIPGVVEQLIPLTIDLPDASAAQPSRVKIVAAVYCGSESDGGADAIGIVAPVANAALPQALSRSDCKVPLPAIATRTINRPGAPDWIDVVKGHLTWAPWRLKLDIIDSAPAARQGTKAPSLNGIKTLASYPTSNLALLPPPGDSRRFDVAFGFEGTAIVALLFTNGSTGAPLSALDAEGSSLRQDWQVPQRANLLVQAQYSFINDLLKTYAPLYEVPIPIEGVSQKMTARDVQVAGSDNTLTISGQLAMAGIAYDCAVHAAGADLVIQQIELNPIAKDCTSDSLMERLQCQGEQMATTGSSQSLANALTNYYRGTPFHYSTQEHPLEFDLGDRQFTATFEALKSSSRETTIREAGNASIRAMGR